MDSQDDVFMYDTENDDHDLTDAEAPEADTDEKHYRILKEDEIKHLQQNDISSVSTALSLSRPTACTFLCRINWNVDCINDKWFADIENDTDPKHSTDEIVPLQPPTFCKICLETVPVENMLSTATCHHLFCTVCWKTYLATSIQDGLRCLTLPCPEPKCKSYVGYDMFDSLLSPDDKDKYYRYLYLAYVDSNPRRKWCPSPDGCDLVIELDGLGDEIRCGCGYKFCWSCSQEWHSPLDCETVSKWIEKNSSEAENTNWILVNTKTCPKCRRAIEKNQGCSHMTCRDPCWNQFCWECLGPWREHRTYDCNRYRNDGNSADERSRQKAKLHLERYAHYYERWASNHKSMVRSVGDSRAARDEHVDVLAAVHSEPQAQLAFVVEAWDQVVECRRVLKWSYAYGFYLSEGKKVLFEHLQGRAEWALETLHHCVEKEMSEFLPPDLGKGDFKEFRKKLVGLTAVTKNYFENLVRALESNLCEFAEVESKKRESSEDEENIVGAKSRRRG